jgi:diguanylate cyclase (GGDEF)-like protein
MKAALRATDMVARWGGEEFLVVLPGTDARELLGVAERLRAVIAEAPFLLSSGPLRVTVSIGAAGLGPGEADFEEALHRADAALYDAKSRGRDRVVCAPARGPDREVACVGLRAA